MLELWADSQQLSLGVPWRSTLGRMLFMCNTLRAFVAEDGDVMLPAATAAIQAQHDKAAKPAPPA